MVPGRLLPPSTAEDLDSTDRPIASLGPVTSAFQRRCLRRWHDDPCVSRSPRFVESDGVVGGIARHARDRAIDPFQEAGVGSCRRIVDGRLGQRLSHDSTGPIDPEMQLLPTALATAAVFHRGPFAFAEHGEAGAVDNEMKRSLTPDFVKGQM